ncbi:hypothetical protein ASG67_08230 [Sphingomonas sp. Leaf339]|nr:hypothetical protein ASG67_08230 [Sphingomonas sp. Leaf339]
MRTAIRRLEDGVEVLTISLSRNSPAPPPTITVRWSLPSVDMAGMWTPSASAGREITADFDAAVVPASLTGNAPVLTLFGRGEQNRLTIAVSDALNPLTLAAKLREEDVRVYGTARIMAERHDPVATYSVDLRFDRRPLPFYDSLRDVGQWWSRQKGYQPTLIPADAREPLDSSWYSYHQDVPDTLMKAEADAARDLGFKVLIVDDGWQTNDGNRGYAYAGDWKPVRLRNMRGFTDYLHGRGMKGMLWFSVPLVGDRSEAYARFKGKFLRHWAEQSTNVLDPRYPEVRAYLVETFRRAVAEWGWDGLKLDFIDMLKSDDATVLTAADGRDYASVYDAVDRLMTDIMHTLRSARRDVLIEFRQPYTGPLIRKYGNMLRASDAPNTSILNRQRIVDLRLLAGSTPVHADPIVWNADDPVEQAAVQLWDTMFGVPQVSMRLAEVDEDHAMMLKNYLDYWRANRGVLMDGRFAPEGIRGNYDLIRATGPTKQIVGLYAPRLVDVDSTMPIVEIVNATASPRVLVNIVGPTASYRMIKTNAVGQSLPPQTIRLGAGPHMLDVPVLGRVSLTRH